MSGRAGGQNLLCRAGVCCWMSPSTPCCGCCLSVCCVHVVCLSVCLCLHPSWSNRRRRRQSCRSGRISRVGKSRSSWEVVVSESRLPWRGYEPGCRASRQLYPCIYIYILYFRFIRLFIRVLSTWPAPPELWARCPVQRSLVICAGRRR